MTSRSRAWHGGLLAVSLAIAAATPALSQDSARGPVKDRVWFTVGAGVGRLAGSAPFAGGLAGGAGLTYQPGLMLFGLQANAVWNPFHADLLGDAALLLGVGTRGPRSHLSIAVGPALADGDLRSFSASREHFSYDLSLAVRAQLLALPLPTIGAGLTGFANVNHHRSFGGVILVLAFGQLR